MLQVSQFLFKSFLILILSVLTGDIVFAQAPQLLNYQGVARNSVGNAIPNKNMTLRVTIRNGSATGSSVYSETRQVRTNGAGLFATQIGGPGATTVSGTVAGINWYSGTKFLQVELDPEGGNAFLDMGTNQLVSVPYALNADNATNVSGIIPITNGGTGASTVAAAKVNFGLGNVDNTSDLTKPISSATQIALNLKEDASNKSANTALGNSDDLFPTQKAVKVYVDRQIISANPDATSTAKGKIQLAGDLTNTAEEPRIANGAVTSSKIADASVTDIKITGISGSKVSGDIPGNAANVNGVITLANGGTGATSITGAKTVFGLENVENTKDADKPVSTATQIALIAKENASNKSTDGSLGASDILFPTQKAVKTYVDQQITSATPNASASSTGKIQLAGDLTNTAVEPRIATGAVTTSKIADASVTDTKVVSISASKVSGNISGNAANVTGTIAIANGGTGATSVTGAKTAFNLENVDNTSDANKPISTAAQTALDSKENTANKSTDVALGSSDVLYPTQKAVKSYVDTKTDSKVSSVGTISGQANANGASITSGVLSLAPANATNGGVVTNGTQTFGGSKTFASDIVVNGVRVGRGAGNNDQNVAIGADALASGTGTRNTAVGYGAMRQYSGTSFDNNTSIGYWNMNKLTTGNGNTSVGAETMLNLTTGSQNTSVGNQSLINTTGNDNVGVGKRSGEANSTGSQNTFVGTNTTAGSGNLTNATAIGYGASVASNNTIQLGNTSVTNVKTSGTITAGAVTYPNTDGTNGQVLSTNGSGTASWITPSYPQYAQKILQGNSDAGNLTNPVTLGGISIRVNNAELEISRVSNNDPSTLVVYATVFQGCCAAFNAAADNSGGPITPKYGTTVVSAGTGTWTKLLDVANGNTQRLGNAYFKLEADITTYDSTKSYKFTAFVDGWGKVIMRLEYFPN